MARFDDEEGTFLSWTRALFSALWGFWLVSNTIGQNAVKLDACALLTKAEAETVLGEPINEGLRGLESEGGEESAAIRSVSILLPRNRL